MIEDFLNSVICGDIENMEIRKAIVKVFIREVILYNDKIVITYSFCDTFSKHTITQTDIKAIEKQSETAAFTYPLGSNKLSNPAPNDEHTNPDEISGFVCFFSHDYFGICILR